MNSSKESGLVTFELVTPYHVRIISSNGIVIGDAWSKLEGHTYPYPHKHPEDNIQICGIRAYVDTGSCGRFKDDDDIVVYFGSGKFKPSEEDYQPTFDFEKGDRRLETNEEILEQLTEAECQPLLKISSPILE